MKKLKKAVLLIDKWVSKLSFGIVFGTTSVLIVTVALQVISRYVFRRPFWWTTELACFMLVYLVFIGSAMALRNNEHVSLDPNLLKVPASVRKVMNVLAVVSVYLFISMVFYFGLYITRANSRSLSEAMKIPYAYLYGVLPVTAVFMAIGYTARLIEKGEKAKEETGNEEGLDK